jgi:hypothetical protein
MTTKYFSRADEYAASNHCAYIWEVMCTLLFQQGKERAMKNNTPSREPEVLSVYNFSFWKIKRTPSAVILVRSPFRLVKTRDLERKNPTDRQEYYLIPTSCRAPNLGLISYTQEGGTGSHTSLTIDISA